MSTNQLLSIKLVTGTLTVVTGLRVGGSQETMEISGLDNPIIRNPADGLPFIPGSSIRGKLRSLAEWYFGELPTDGKVIAPNRQSKSARVFGLPADPNARHGPTRLIVRDAILSKVSREQHASGRPITEVKSENSINRITAMANPRPMERVLPGVTFDCEFVYRIFDIDGDRGQRDQSLFAEVFLQSLALLQLDALGGGGSRGNGKVSFELFMDGNKLQLPIVTFPDRSPQLARP